VTSWAANASTHAEDPPEPPSCAPLACAADYIGVTTNDLAAIVALGNRSGRGGGLAGMNLVLKLLDAARQTKLGVGVDPHGPVREASVEEIVAAHDRIRDSLAEYAVSGLVPMTPP
jgi:hypothetical protein